MEDVKAALDQPFVFTTRTELTPDHTAKALTDRSVCVRWQSRPSQGGLNALQLGGQWFKIST